MDGSFTLTPHKSAHSTARLLHQLQRCKKLVLSYWWILILCLGAAIGIQVLLLRRTPPSFVSEARMIVNVKLSIPNANIYSEELNNFFGTQVALMESASVVNRVNGRLRAAGSELHPSPVGIQVSLAPKTSIFNLRAVGTDAKYTQAFLEATMNEYISLKKELLENASSSTKSGIKDELARMTLELHKSKQDILDFQSTNSVVFLQQNGGNSAAEYLSSLSRQLSDRKSELQLLKLMSATGNNSSAAESVALNSVTSSGQTNGSATSSDGLKATDFALGTLPFATATLDSPYAQAKKELVPLLAERDRMLQLTPPPQRVIDALNQRISDQERLLQFFVSQNRELLEAQRHALEAQIQELERQIVEWQGKALDASKKLSDFEVLKENGRRLQSLCDQLSVTLQTLDVDKGIGQDSVTILEPATPAVPNPPQIRKHLIMAGLIGFVAWIGILFLLDRLDDRLTSVVELEELFDKPILAQLPKVAAKDRKTGVTILENNDIRHRMVEAYYNLRSALVSHVPATKPRSIVITSASPNDGKSMIASNLAITLAQSGARVLLVDADLRRGGLNKQFSTAASPGLAEVLAEQCEWSKAVVPTAFRGLSLMPCGVSPRHPGSLFAKQSARFLEEIAGQYDYYLFDTAPVLAADDISSLVPHVDGLIMVVRSGFTSGRMAQAALDLLHFRKANVIGLVLNSVRPGAMEYFYYGDTDYYFQPRGN